MTRARAFFRRLGWVAALLLLPVPSPGLAAPPLVLERRIPLPRVAGRIDHMAYDPGRRRLMVAELGNDTADLIDLAAGRPIRRITGLAEPQGIAFSPVADRWLVANGGDGTVRLFDAATLGQTGRIALGDDADDAEFLPDRGTVLVGFGEGGLAEIDPGRGMIVARLPLPAHPEAFRADPAEARIFVNVPERQRIIVVDRRSGATVARWRTPGLSENFPMALDHGAGLLAVGFRAPPRLALIATKDGRIVARRHACQDADDVFFDARRHMLYVSCGAGSVDVFRFSATRLDRVARIDTLPGARTSLFVPSLDRLIVAAPAPLLGGVPASLLIFRPTGKAARTTSSPE